MVRFCMGLVEDKRFDNIMQRFPIRGHSFLDCDRIFGAFKKKIKKVDRIYHPMDYVELIANAKSRIEVKIVQADDIYDFNKWWPPLFKKTCLSVESYGKQVARDQKQTFTPAAFMEFQYSANSGIVTASPYIGGLIKHTFNLRQPGRRPQFTQMFKTLVPAYHEGKVPINLHKVEAVRLLLKYIPEENRKFYEDYLSWPTTNTAENE